MIDFIYVKPPLIPVFKLAQFLSILAFYFFQDFLFNLEL